MGEASCSMRPKLHSLILVVVLSAASCLATIDLGYDLPDDAAGGTGGAGGAGVCEPGAEEPCYTGPEGTEGVGLCRAGTMTCKADGSGYEACQGEITPTAENCASATDEDCDGLAPPCSGTLLWAKRFGDAQDQIAWCVDTADDGNITLSGTMNGSVDFGGGLIASEGFTDLFVATFSGDGEHVHSASYGDAADQIGGGVAVRPEGGYSFAGSFRGAIDLGTNHASNGDADVFLARMDGMDSPLWSVSFGGANPDHVANPAVDAAGNTTIGGSFRSESIDLGSGPILNAGLSDAFLARYDKTGALVWGARYGDGSDQIIHDVAMDRDGGAVVVGTFEGTLDFGNGAISSVTGRDFFVARFDADGSPLWSARYGGAAADEEIYVTVDSAGNVILGLVLLESVDFGGGPLASTGLKDAAIVKLDSSGGHLWSRRYGDASHQSVLDIEVDGADNIIVAGIFNGSIDLGGGPLAEIGAMDAFVAKLDPGAGHIWSRRMGAMSGSWTMATGIRADPDLNVIVVGMFSGSLGVDGDTTLTSAGGFDVFVAKFKP